MHKGGWKISLNYVSILKTVQAKCPSAPSPFAAAIIQMGGNDLCLHRCNPLKIASKLEDLAQRLQEDRMIKVVYIYECRIMLETGSELCLYSNDYICFAQAHVVSANISRL